MKEKLTKLLTRNPFHPFAIRTKLEGIHKVTDQTRLCVGDRACGYVEDKGFVVLIPFSEIMEVWAGASVAK